MPERLRCDICNDSIPPHAHYVVRIDVFFNPDMPEVTADELDEMDFDENFRNLIQQMQGLTPEEAQDQVARRFEYAICPKCQPQFLLNPLGMPRKRPVVDN